MPNLGSRTGGHYGYRLTVFCSSPNKPLSIDIHSKGANDATVNERDKLGSGGESKGSNGDIEPSPAVIFQFPGRNTVRVRSADGRCQYRVPFNVTAKQKFAETG
jgi:hypothetical protein